MDKKLETALNNVETTYGELVEIANGMLNPMFEPINAIISRVSASVNAMSIDQIRDYILTIQLKAFEISEIKEKAALKAELAETLQREKFAVSFNGLEGSAAAKDKLALVETSAEIVTEALYNLVANLLKTKLDQLHRLVDALKSILMSRMQETKFMNIGSTNEVPSTCAFAGVDEAQTSKEVTQATCDAMVTDNTALTVIAGKNVSAEITVKNADSAVTYKINVVIK